MYYLEVIRKVKEAAAMGREEQHYMKSKVVKSK